MFALFHGPNSLYVQNRRASNECLLHEVHHFPKNPNTQNHPCKSYCQTHSFCLFSIPPHKYLQYSIYMFPDRVENLTPIRLRTLCHHAIFIYPNHFANLTPINLGTIDHQEILLFPDRASYFSQINPGTMYHQKTLVFPNRVLNHF